MKKIFKIIGVVALALILICNLEYAIFSGDITNTPNKALADWYSGSTHYCGTSPNTSLVVGKWEWKPTPSGQNPVYWNSGYEAGYYLFTPGDFDTGQCGPNLTSDCCGDVHPPATNPHPHPQMTTDYHTTGDYGPY